MNVWARCVPRNRLGALRLACRDRARPDRQRTVALLAALALVAAGCGDDEEAAPEPTVTATDAWALATPPGATVGAAYVTLRSSGDDALVGVSVDAAVAASAELHTTTVVDGSNMSSMDHMSSLALPADDDVTLDPGGSHAMLVDLAAPLAAGTTFELTLDFELAPDVTVTVDVLAAPPA